MSFPSLLLQHLPDDLLYHIFTYVETAVNIGPFLGRVISCISKDMKRITDHDSIWEIVLSGLSNTEESLRSHSSCNTNNPKKRKKTNQKSQDLSVLFMDRKRRRDVNSRLRPTTAKEQVIIAYHVIRDQTEMALQDFSEICLSGKPQKLSQSLLRSILKNYGNVNVNQRSRNGDTFLVDCCRARNVSERVIYNCVKELIQNYHADPNLTAILDGHGYTGTGRTKTNTNINCFHAATVPPLVIAAARGMPMIVQYLINVGALHTVEGTCRFRLHTVWSTSIRGTYNARDFSMKMKEAELSHGATEDDVKSLTRCISILERSHRS